MTLSSIKPYTKLLIIAGIILVLLIIVIISLLPKRQKPQPVGEIAPTQTIPPIQDVRLEQPQNFQTDLQKIAPILPFKSAKFEIVYQQSPNILTATVFATTPQQYLVNKTEAENLIKSKGVSDICSLNIFWNPPLTLIKKINAQDTITTGCPPSPAR